MSARRATMLPRFATGGKHRRTQCVFVLPGLTRGRYHLAYKRGCGVRGEGGEGWVTPVRGYRTLLSKGRTSFVRLGTSCRWIWTSDTKGSFLRSPSPPLPSLTVSHPRLLRVHTNFLVLRNPLSCFAPGFVSTFYIFSIRAMKTALEFVILCSDR